MVESQHRIATRKLVDSDDEQQLLEQLIDSAKPPERAPRGLHYLLFTPFRYPPHRHGSRFGRRDERGIWYGSETQRTAFSEVAFYRFLFLEGSKADLGLLQTELTTFRASIRTDRGIDLTAHPFAAHVAVLTSRTSYHETQLLGSSMREGGVETFRFVSARDVDGGLNVGVLSPAAFGRRAPKSLETWHCAATRNAVELSRQDYFARGAFRFPREEFLEDGVLPQIKG